MILSFIIIFFQFVVHFQQGIHICACINFLRTQVDMILTINACFMGHHLLIEKHLFVYNQVPIIMIDYVL